jgi:hypothetical protein
MNKREMDRERERKNMLFSVYLRNPNENKIKITKCVNIIISMKL